MSVQVGSNPRTESGAPNIGLEPHHTHFVLVDEGEGAPGGRTSVPRPRGRLREGEEGQEVKNKLESSCIDPGGQAPMQENLL